MTDRQPEYRWIKNRALRAEMNRTPGVKQARDEMAAAWRRMRAGNPAAARLVFKARRLAEISVAQEYADNLFSYGSTDYPRG